MPSEQQILESKQELKKICSKYLSEAEFSSYQGYRKLISAYVLEYAAHLEEIQLAEQLHEQFKKSQNILSWLKNKVITSEEDQNYDISIKKSKDSLDRVKFNFTEKLKEQYANILSEFIIKFINLDDPELIKSLKEMIFSQTKDLELKNYFNLKIDLLTYFYSKSKEQIISKQLPIQTISQDIELIGFQLMQDNHKQAVELLNSIPGIYMLSAEHKSQFIKELFYMFCQGSLNQLKNQSYDVNSSKNDLLHAIDFKIQEAANTYEIPEEDLSKIEFTDQYSSWKIWGENDPENTRIQAIIQAKKIFNNIKGTHFLPAVQQKTFINKLTILEQKEQIGKNEQYRLMKYLKPYQESAKAGCIEEIKQSIQDLLTKDPETIKIKDNIEEQIKIELIADQKLKIEFQKNILIEIVSYIQQDKDPASFNLNRLKQYFSQIEIAKLLCKIKNFHKLSLDEQINKIDQVNDILNNIKSINDNVSDDEDLKAIDNYTFELKNIIDEIAMDAFIDEYTKKQLGIDDDFILDIFKQIENYPGVVRNNIKNAILEKMAKMVPSQIKTITSIFKPFKYIVNKVADVYKKPRSYLDKSFRIGIGIVAGAAMVAGAGTIIALAANPVSLPIIAVAGLGIIATPAVVSGSMKLAKIISNKVAKYFYGIADPDLYIPSKEAINLLGGKEQAQQVADFFKQELIDINNKIDIIVKTNKNPNIIQGLNNQWNILSEAWGGIQNGSSKDWEGLSKKLYINAKNENNTQLKNIDTNDMINSLMDLTLPKAIENDDANVLNREASAKTVGPKRNLVSFFKQNELNERNQAKMLKLTTINDIIKNSNR